ncbi:MAG: HAD family hydrolase [Elusimicrobiaceae bacterium]
MKKNVIFDLGGVLVDWNPRYFYRSVFNDDEKMEDFLSSCCNSEWIVAMDAGITAKENIARGQKACPKYAKELVLYDEGWYSMFGGAIEGTVEILKNLKRAGTPLYALTNWSAEKFPWAKENFPFFNLFDGIVVSGEEKIIKPNPEIYKRLLNRYNLKAENCIFIDDSPANVAAARALGMEGIVFVSPLSLKKQLSALAQ